LELHAPKLDRRVTSPQGGDLERLLRNDIRCEDVIPHNDVLITTGAGAVSQFKLDVNGIALLSAITPDQDGAATSAQKPLAEIEHELYK